MTSTTTVSKVPTSEEKAEEKKVEATASLSEVFMNAEPLDYLLMFGGVFGGAITGLSLPAFNVLFGRMLNALNGSADSLTEGIAKLCIAFVVIAVINLFSGFLQVYCWTKTGERQTQKFREKYVNAILSQEIGWFDTCGAGELSTRVAELIGKIQDGMGRKVGDLIQYLAQILGSFAVAFWLCWQLTVVLIACFPLIAGAGAFMINAITAAQNQTLGQYAAAGGLATESLGAIRTITALNSQPDVITRYRLYLFQAMQVGIVKGFKVGLGNGGLFCACFLTYALGFWYGGKLVADDKDGGCTDHCLTGGTILSVFFCTIMGSMALGQMAPPLVAFATAKAAVASILEVVSRKPLIDGLSHEGLIPQEKTQGVIQISDVTFAYPSRPNIDVCKRYDLTINAGESIALVGASGCGKSTIINLLLRFYDPQSGTITMDGRDIKSLNIRWLRSQIGYVGQEPILFAGSIGDNISYGLDPELLGNTADTVNSPKKLSKEKLQEMIVQAAKLANAHSFISDFPQGYDTDVGSNGIAMSGGQKQRIAIARALIKKPSILLLDEATSALDAASERVVQASIDKLQTMKSQSIVIIAHRLSTIRNADRICLIDRGSIAEMGSHDELIAKNGLYADLVRLQMSGHDDDVKDGEEVAEGEEVEDENVAAGAESPAGSSPRGRKRTVSGGAGESEKKKDAATTAAAAAAASKEAEKPALAKEESKKVASRVWAMLRQHTGWMIVGCLGAAVFGGIFPSWGLMLAHSQNMFYLTDTTELRRQARLYAFMYILLGGVSLISATCQFWGVAQFSERVSMNLRSQMFEALMRRNIGYFDLEENSIGTLTTRLSDDSRIVNKAFGDSLARQLQAFFCLAVALILGFRASWRVAFVVIAAFPINIIASAIQMQAISGQQYENEDKVQGAVTFNGADNAKEKAKKASANGTNGGGVVSGGHGAIISTAFTHMRTVSAFSMQHKVSEHYAKVTNERAEAAAKRGFVAGFGFGGSQTALFLTYALLFWYGGTLIKSGDVTFLELMTAILTLMLGALGLGTALADLGDQKVGVETAHRIFQSIDEGNCSPIDGLSTTGVVPSAKATGRIVLTNVNFRYPTREDVQVCKEFSLEIEPGEMVALVGPSGSGKSTIISLLQRFYDPLSGTITLDGHDTKSLNVRWLRSQIGFVGQEPVLFTGSVAQNVAKGRVETVNQPMMSLAEAMRISDEANGGCGAYFDCLKTTPAPANHTAVSPQEVDIEMGKIAKGSADPDVVEACVASNAHDFITSFTQGYDTDIGEGSIMVSGGQKQRIAIARALIKKPSILLLDEATSALDATSERVVQASIDALQAQKTQTTIVIAHRLSTIKSADKIIVVDKGLVVETGKHDELVARGGLYAQLWAKQSGTDSHTPPRNSPFRGTSQMAKVTSKMSMSQENLAAAGGSDN